MGYSRRFGGHKSTNTCKDRSIIHAIGSVLETTIITLTAIFILPFSFLCAIANPLARHKFKCLLDRSYKIADVFKSFQIRSLLFI